MQIKIFSSGVNPVDTYIREGCFLFLPDLPFVPGMDGAGIVQKIGSEVTKFKVRKGIVCKVILCLYLSNSS